MTVTDRLTLTAEEPVTHAAPGRAGRWMAVTRTIHVRPAPTRLMGV